MNVVKSLASPLAMKARLSGLFLGTPANLNSYGRGINNLGQVVGFSQVQDLGGFLYSNGQLTPLRLNVGNAINDLGQATGYANTSADRYSSHAFLYTDGQMKDLGTLPGGSYSTGFGINSAGQVVGYSGSAGGSVHAFLHQNGQMLDLNDLVDPATHFIDLSLAEGINDKGQMIANDGGHAYLLTPVPEPGTLALFEAALLGLGAWVRRYSNVLR